MKASATQHRSAKERVAEVPMFHAGEYAGVLTVGVTPERIGGEPVVLVHFCSLVLTDMRMLKPGDGILIPVEDHSYEVRLPNGLYVVKIPSILQFPGIFRPNGNLNILRAADQALAVPVPKRLRSRSPWIYQGGSEEVAEAYGYELSDLFASDKAELVTV